MASTPLQASAPSWATSSVGHAAHASPAEQSALASHLHTCRLLGGRLQALRSGGEAVHRFLAGRIVTTAVVAALLLLGALALLS